MYLPSKFISNEQSLLNIGGQILKNLNQPRSISSLWEVVKTWRHNKNIKSPLPFWWFSMALNSLFALGVIELKAEMIVRKNDA